MAYRVINETRGRELGSRVRMANWWWPRLRGLIGRESLEKGEGLLLVPSKAVHMYGVMFPIDVAFLDRDKEIVALYRNLAPGTRTRWHGSSRTALELPSGLLAETGTTIGDRLTWRKAGDRR